MNIKSEISRNTRELLDLKQQEYAKILATYILETIQRAFMILSERRKKVKLNDKKLTDDAEILDENTIRIFELMSQYEQDIKQIFINNGEIIIHITNISPDKMDGGKISQSVNRANHYETERGNWVFASSSPIDGWNPYIARDSKSGMILIGKKTYIYGSDNMQILQANKGENRVILKKPNYVYRIKPEKFRPVVTLMRDNDGKPYFKFSEEWVSDEEVDISDSKQVIGVEEITDVTELIKNYQILCDVSQTGEARRIISSSNREEAIKILLSSIRSGKLRYINGEADRKSVV